MQTEKQNPDIEVIDLSYYWYLFKQNLPKLLALAFIITVLATLFAYTSEPVYKATTSMLIEAKEAKVVAIENVYGYANDSKEYFLTQYELLASRELARRVVKKLRLVKTREFNPYFEAGEPPPFISEVLSALNIKEDPSNNIISESDVLEATIDEFHGSIIVEPVRLTQLVDLSIESTNPKLAAQAANALAESYIELQQDAKLGINKQANAWLTKRLDELKDKLKISEERLLQYQKENNLIDIKGSTTLVTKELEAITTNLVEARARRLQLESTHEQLRLSNSRSYTKLSTLPAVLKHPLVQNLRSRETTAELKISELSKRYGHKHPRMIAAKSELETAKNATLIQMRRIAEGIENDYKAALDNEKSLQSALEDVKAKIRTVSRFESKMNEFAREVEANKQLYTTFYSRVRETNVTDDLQVASARVIDSAIIPKEPVWPNKKLVAGGAFFVTLIFGFALVILSDMLNSTIRGPEDVEHKLGVPLIGLAPIISNKVARHRWVFSMADNSDRHFCESLRTIRTSITLATMDSESKVLMITSSIPAEGKTTMVINLATAYAQINEKVLLIDADMRRPKVATELNLERKDKGLSNAIICPSDIHKCIQRVDEIGLDVLASGQLYSNPLELLSSSNFSYLLEQLRTKYDRILIDTAPLQSVSDALYLSTLVDCVLYVVKSEGTPDKFVKSGLERLQDSKGALLGVVLSQVDISKKKNIGGGYYDYFDYDPKKVN